MDRDPSALESIKNLENFMELNSYLMFRQTEDYLWLKLRATGYTDPEAWATLIELGSKRRAEAWQIAQEMATSILKDQWDSRGHEYQQSDLDSVVRKLAEKLLVEQDICPPTFNKWCECETCGRMPVPERFQAEQSANCPWCLSGVSGI
jgi:hypothetical protein